MVPCQERHQNHRNDQNKTASERYHLAGEDVDRSVNERFESSFSYATPDVI